LPNTKSHAVFLENVFQYKIETFQAIFFPFYLDACIFSKSTTKNEEKFQLFYFSFCVSVGRKNEKIHMQ